MNRNDASDEQPLLLPGCTSRESVSSESPYTNMTKVYFDTNQLYSIRRIAEEAQGSDYGDYEWAYRMFHNDPQLVQDIRTLCYIVAMQYEWNLDFLPSDGSFAELSLSTGGRAQATRGAWLLFAEGLNDGRHLRDVPFWPMAS